MDGFGGLLCLTGFFFIWFQVVLLSVIEVCYSSLLFSFLVSPFSLLSIFMCAYVWV